MKIPDFLNENAENEDIYNRYPIVESIYNSIKNNKKYWLKIWLYWKWGAWKTFILNQLKERINSEVKNWELILVEPKVIFLNIKNVENIEDVYSCFLEDIRESFGVFKDTAFLVFKVFLSILFGVIVFSFVYWFGVSFIQAFNKSWVDLNNLLQVKNLKWISLSLLVTLLVTGVYKFIFSKNFFAWYNKYYDWISITLYLYIKKLLWRKVLIVVDDLDRLKPDFLPEVLLWLNRVSTINKGIVDLIISADPLKLSEWIKKSNSQYIWNEWYEFLEKIIDIPYYIDDLPSKNKHIFLNKYKYALQKDYGNFKYIENFVDLLPDNTRQIKRYFRFLYSCIGQLKRYWNEEINFELLFFILLFKLQNPSECLGLLLKMNKFDFGWIFAIDKNKIKDEFEKDCTESQKPYFRYLKDKLLFNIDLQSYYYFFDNLEKVTNKEFYDDFLIGEKDFADFEQCFDGDYIEMMLKLSYFKDYYYSHLISSTTNEMKIYNGYLMTIYNFLEKTLSHFQYIYFISNDKFTLILRGLNSYSNFDFEKSWIDFSMHRKKDKEIIIAFVKKISPEIVFKEVPSMENFDFLAEVTEQIYWESILSKIDKDKIDLYDHQVRNFVYKKIITENSIAKLPVFNINNDVINENIFNILYIVLSKINNDWIETNFNKETIELFKRIKFNLINYRTLGSFEQDVLNKLNSDYKESLKYFYLEVNKYTVNKS